MKISVFFPPRIIKVEASNINDALDLSIDEYVDAGVLPILDEGNLKDCMKVIAFHELFTNINAEQ